MSMRAEANTGPENRMMDILREIGFGDLLNLLITALAATETGIAITANVATLAAQPTTLFQVLGVAGTAGAKTILKGPITGPQKVTPAPGFVVWDGGKKLLFNVADLNTTATITYATAANVTCSVLARDIGQNP
jgi:hypothetical protein